MSKGENATIRKKKAKGHKISIRVKWTMDFQNQYFVGHVIETNKKILREKNQFEVIYRTITDILNAKKTHSVTNRKSNQKLCGYVRPSYSQKRRILLQIHKSMVYSVIHVELCYKNVLYYNKYVKLILYCNVLYVVCKLMLCHFNIFYCIIPV